MTTLRTMRLAVAFAALVSCRPDEPDRASLQPLLLWDADETGSEPDDLTIVAARHRSLLRAFAETPDSVARYLAMSFTFVDASDPMRSFSRELTGRPLTGQDYFRVLSGVVPPYVGVDPRIEVLPERGNTIIVVTTHGDSHTTLTAWLRTDGEWRAARMTINAPPAHVDATRRAYGAAAPRRPN